MATATLPPEGNLSMAIDSPVINPPFGGQPTTGQRAPAPLAASPRTSQPRQPQAAQIVAPRQIVVAKQTIPAPAPGEVLVRVEGCGLCGSNLPVWEGREWFTYPLPPGNPGHEAWGRIIAFGADHPPVTDETNSSRARDNDGDNHGGNHSLQLGDRVAMLSYNGFADYDVAALDAVVKLPETLADQPFPGEPLACAFNVFERSRIAAGEQVAIVGIGFLGALLTALAAAAGAEVIAITRRPFALAMARRYGAAHTIVMDDHWQIVEQVQALTNAEGCDCVIEAVGAQWPLDLAAELTKIRGRLIVAGYHQDGPRQVNMQQWNWRGLDVINAHERDPARYVAGMRAAVAAVAAGKLDLAPLFTHRFDLNNLAQAFTTAAERPDGFMKALIMMDQVDRA
jgi:2-desacetyl-2-hydroxyethyl bacteriochlorophyllide A dehydrogenase